MDDELKRVSDIFMLAFVTWREARGERPDVRAGVAFSILNRVKRPSWWGNDVLSVCTKKWQYSSLTDPKDRQLTTWPLSIDPSWQSCLKTAREVLDGKISNPVLGADSYFDISIPAPKWAVDETFVKQLGRVRFHNVDHDTEQ